MSQLNEPFLFLSFFHFFMIHKPSNLSLCQSDRHNSLDVIEFQKCMYKLSRVAQTNPHAYYFHSIDFFLIHIAPSFLGEHIHSLPSPGYGIHHTKHYLKHPY
eukprot:TRINITY_DN9252_c0_g1_i2.p1 TRINITY_DN9252_c0_g1~~TRINITY_DN9252_c0_g1_i2.p1  ORF type:complete len:102 (+),score=9.14 TRINITY_DN9252_c0_g1_i2:651-956(+)